MHSKLPHYHHRLCFQCLCMIGDVLSNERCNEKVAVIVAFAYIVDACDASITARSDQIVRQQLLLVQEFVVAALVDAQHQLWPIVILNQFSGVPFIPQIGIFAQIPGEAFLSPWAVDWICNWRKCRHRPIQAGTTKRRYQCTVSAHAVPEDALNMLQCGEIVIDQFDQLLGDVCEHFVVFIPWIGDGVHIETGTGTKIVRIIFARQFDATWWCVWAHDNDTMFGSVLLGAGFLDEIGFVAGETAQPIQHRQFLGRILTLRRQINGKFHFARQLLGMMRIDLLVATETLVRRYQRNLCHDFSELPLRRDGEMEREREWEELRQKTENEKKEKLKWLCGNDVLRRQRQRIDSHRTNWVNSTIWPHATLYLIQRPNSNHK